MTSSIFDQHLNTWFTNCRCFYYFYYGRLPPYRIWSF